MAVIVAVDAGTTGIRAFAVDEEGKPRDWSYRELVQHFPQPGWVEHDPVEIWTSVLATLGELAKRLEAEGETIAAVGLTNQRETVVAWDRRTGQPRHPAIVWQDRRTAARCDELAAAGHLPMVRERTGLVLDPYFSASKIEWLLREGGVEADANLALGTIDSWLLWNLTGGALGGVHATEPSNASRTLLFDIERLQWSSELTDLFGVPRQSLPVVMPSSGRFGATAEGLPCPAGIPVSGIAGDQQAALFGQACFRPGASKNTYGTGSFVLMNVGSSVPPPTDGLLTTVGWQLGPGTGASAGAGAGSASCSGGVTYALEGAIFATGAAVQWLRDGLGIIETAADLGPLAETCSSTEGVYVVPAFSGLGSPWWDPYARGTIVGITRGTSRAHLARAVVEAMAYQTRDVVDAMVAASGRLLPVLRVDGGASACDLLLQLQADQLQVPVARPVDLESSAIGAAWLAGLAEGMWSLADLERVWQLDVEVHPTASTTAANRGHANWRRAVNRSLTSPRN